MAREVVVTGLGVVTALGIGAGALWEGLCAGRSGLARITRFDPSGFPCGVGGEIKNLSAKDFVPKSYRKAVKVMARDIELAVAAANLAVTDAGLVTRATRESGDAGAAMTYDAGRMGCHIGAGLITTETEELTSALVTAVDKNGAPERSGFDFKKWGAGPEGGGAMLNLQPLWMLKYLPNMLACHVTIVHGAEGPSNTITCSEASGLLSIGESARVIERGAADLCFSGGAESKINVMSLLRGHLAGRLATASAEVDPLRIVKPFDPASGGVPAEAGGILILEEKGCAAARGARAYAKIAGFGTAQGSSQPLALGNLKNIWGGSESEGLELAIAAALRDAGATPDSIDAIVPQGAGVPSLDAPEAAALRAIFGGRLSTIPLVTLTPQIGDSWAGNGGVQVAVGCLCLHEQRLPARMGAARVEGLDAEARPSMAAALRRVLVCTRGFGGQNAAVVLDRAA